jgi:methanethiol S-methyltransferase
MTMIMEHLLIVIFWLLFGLWHSVFAAPVVKRKAEKWMGSYYSWYRPVYSIIAFVQTALILVYQFSIESKYLWQNGPGASSVFTVFALAGLVVMAISVKKYFFNLSGIQVLYKKKNAPVLETGGLHEYLRHPLYGGTLLFAWSVFLIFPMLSYLLTCITMTAYTLVGIQLEEKKLENLFGQQYRVYKNNVPMIIPFTKFGRLSKPLPDKLS